MNIASRTRHLVAASLLFVGFVSNVSQAQQTINLNGVLCAAATITLGAGTININTPTTCGAVISPPQVGAPIITLVSPGSGQVGTIVTITGTGLTGATVTIGGAATTVTVGSATSITTTVPVNAPVTAGNLVVTTGGGAVSSAFTVTAAVAGDLSIDGIPLPNPSKLAFTVPPARNGLKGAGPDIAAYAMNPARCNTIPALTRSWQHNVDLNDYKSKNAFDFIVMQGGESLSYKFVVGDVDVSGGFVFNDSANAIVRPTFMSLTSVPCDFDTSKLLIGPTRDACYQTASNGNSVGWANISGPIPSTMCKLIKGQTYYLNIRFQDGRLATEGGTPTQDSCVSGNCGGVLQVL